MEQWTEPTSAPHPTEPDTFNATPLPAHPPSEQNTESRREKLQLLWGHLLQAAVRDPGLLLDAYSRFHGYSLGNRLAALVQCHARGLEPGPIHTYQGWKQLGYQVKSGEKALWLCMPLTRKTKSDATKDEKQAAPEKNENCGADGHSLSTQVISAFVWKPHWFVLSQVGPIPGQEMQPIENTALGVWHKAKALQALGISEIPFDLLDGNCQGYAKERTIAVSPLAALPYKTLIHEMAHVVLGHTAQKENSILLIDEGELPTPQPRHVCEAEAEATALILLATLNLPGQEYCRGYIQSWLKGEGIGEGSARRVFGAADKMLRAGLSEESGEGDDFTHGAPVPTPPPPAPVLPQAAENALQPAMQFQQMPGTVLTPAEPALLMPCAPEANGHGALLHKADFQHSPQTTAPTELAMATLPRPPTREASGAFSLNGEWDLFQLLMGLHEASADLHPMHDPHPDVGRALAYLGAKDAEQVPALLFWLHRAAEALQSAAQVANGAINWPAIAESYEPQALPFPTAKQSNSEARAALNGSFLGRSGAGQSPRWLAQTASEVAAPEPDQANNSTEPLNNAEAVNGTPALNGKPSSARAEASARRTLGRALRSELVTEQRRFFLLAEKHELPTGRENAKVIRDAISRLLEIPVKSRADLTARQWALAASAIETGDLRW